MLGLTTSVVGHGLCAPAARSQQRARRPRAPRRCAGRSHRLRARPQRPACEIVKIAVLEKKSGITFAVLKFTCDPKYNTGAKLVVGAFFHRWARQNRATRAWALLVQWPTPCVASSSTTCTHAPAESQAVTSKRPSSWAPRRTRVGVSNCPGAIVHRGCAKTKI